MVLRVVDSAGILKLGLEKHNVKSSTAQQKQEQQRLNFRKFYETEPQTFCDVFRSIQEIDAAHRIKDPSP
jgi:hypothetical protein